MGTRLKRWSEHFGQFLIVFLFLTTALLWVHGQSEYLFGNDGFYHAKLAYLYGQQGFLDTFPWASLSRWREAFSDKEPLFHVALIPFVHFFGLELGSKVASIAMGGLFFLSFFFVLLLNSVRWPAFWTAFLFLSPGFVLRVSLLRPHVFSSALLLWVVHFLVRRRYNAAALLVFLYGLSYTAIHFPLLVACLLLGVAFFRSARLESIDGWGLAKLGVAAIAAVVVHPHFPENVSQFWVQNFHVLFEAARPGSELVTAREMLAESSRVLFQGGLGAFLALGAVVLSGFWQPQRLTRVAQSYLVLAIAFCGMSLFSWRFIEYAVPFSVLGAAFYFSEAKFTWDSAWGRRSTVAASVVAIGAIAGFSTIVVQENLQRASEAPGTMAAAHYLKGHTKQDEVVHLCHWGLSPIAFFYNHWNRYQIFLDPAFTYAYYPKAWQLWEKANRSNLAGDALASHVLERLGTRHAVCFTEDSMSKALRKSDHVKEVFQSHGVSVFHVAPLPIRSRVSLGAANGIMHP